MTNSENLSREETISVYYHDIFDYPLTLQDLIKWKFGGTITLRKLKQTGVEKSGKYYFLKGRERLVFKRLRNERYSKRKMEIARKAGNVISFNPFIQMVGVTGALAMNNADGDSDIDLMIIAKAGRLWTARVIAYFIAKMFGLKIRKPGETDEKDKLCINIWLDEESLAWDRRDRNIYTAHEIAQIVPIVNKNNTYERLVQKNKWIIDFWPNAVKINENVKSKVKKTGTPLLELILFKLQYLYMRKKISREVIGLHKALFHPRNWGERVAEKLL